MNNFLAAFSSLHDQVFQGHKNEALDLANIFIGLLEELYDFMSCVSTAYNDSANSMRNILCELNIVEALQRFDENTLHEIKPSMQKLSEIIESYKNENKVIFKKIIQSKDRVEREQRCLENVMPNFDMLRELGYADGLSISNEDDWFSKTKKALILSFSNFINEVEKIANSNRIKRFGNLSESLQTLNHKTEEFSKMTFQFYQSIDESLTDIENYTLTVNRLLRGPLLQENNERIVLLATFMVPETKELQENFQKLREKALQNKGELGDMLIHFSPRSLINN
ncbi:hypothetical protein INT48_002059 [Thamnidium elegans]|uniref:Uncharacterized protein n=1 Tax=Thamnidium elegans TaxID=101142 RepID=A0A8H7VXJ7_9FUNG|nr:hypothetical protein INT48_002059 [Thamnidium elegans]